MADTTKTQAAQPVQPKPPTALQLAQKTQESVLAKVKAFQEKGELRFPANYSPENALKSAWLKIQQTNDRNGRPAIEVCTQTSIANAMLTMVVQGLNCDKLQCYFICYSTALTCQRSYFGSQAVAKMVNPNVLDFRAQPIYDGDTLEYEIRSAKKYITKHVQAFGNIDKKNIIGAYCTVIQADGDNYSDIMTMDEIKKAWEKSPTKPFDERGELKPNSTHGQYTADMACKTVINHAAKHIINTSDDSSLITTFAKQNDEDNARAEAEAEIAENAGQGEFVDVDYREVIDPETGEVKGAIEGVQEQATGEAKA
jgi:recombination protein RecT